MDLADLKNFDNFEKDSVIWNQCVEYIKENCKDDPLYENYLELDPLNFLYFNAVTYQGKIISFGGVEHKPKRWGREFVRVLSKFWIHPDYRTKGLTKWGAQHIRFSPFLLSYQLDFLKSCSFVSVAMITREGNYKKSFKEIVRLASTVSDDHFEILEDIYDICNIHNSDTKKCFQMIALSSLGTIDKKQKFEEYRKNGFFKKVSDTI